MRGDSFHNNVLVGRLRQIAVERGATVYTEQPVRIGAVTCYADLLVEKDGRRIVGEAEQSCRRVEKDVQKAVALGAQLLLIVTPDSLTAQACRRQLRRQASLSARIKVIVCPLGAALEILRQTLDTPPNAPAAPMPPAE